MSIQKKISFTTTFINFQGFLLPGDGVTIDPDKVNATREWSTPSSIHEDRNFNSLGTFNERFAKGFSTIMALITNSLKKGEFKWTKAASKVFEKIRRLSTVEILDSFEVVYALGAGIGGV